ncbi:MAG: hypothetical protein JWL62_3652 [Hyphomicrobiales bacterium]|nr:hypothetical protein [Hyphomicrobiales bacterium]
MCLCGGRRRVAHYDNGDVTRHAYLGRARDLTPPVIPPKPPASATGTSWRESYACPIGHFTVELRAISATSIALLTRSGNSVEPALSLKMDGDRTELTSRSYADIGYGHRRFEVKDSITKECICKYPSGGCPVGTAYRRQEITIEAAAGQTSAANIAAISQPARARGVSVPASASVVAPRGEGANGRSQYRALTIGSTNRAPVAEALERSTPQQAAPTYPGQPDSGRGLPQQPKMLATSSQRLSPIATQQPATANPDREKKASEKAIPSTAVDGRVPLDEVRRRFDLSSYANASLHDRVTVLTDSKVFTGFPTTDETYNSEIIKAISAALKRSDYQDLIACSALAMFMERGDPGMLKAAAGISLISNQMSSDFGFGNADEAMLRSAKDMANRNNQELRDMMVKCGKLMVLGMVLIP